MTRPPMSKLRLPTVNRLEEVIGEESAWGISPVTAAELYRAECGTRRWFYRVNSFKGCNSVELDLGHRRVIS